MIPLNLLPARRRDFSGSLMVMLTYACQLRCAYCGVSRSGGRMSWKTLRSALDLLFTAERERLQLRYFGGEPLIRFDLIRRAIKYAETRGGRAGKTVRHMITTNGLLLDKKKLSTLAGHDVEVMFSLDGSAGTHQKWRPAAGGRSVHAQLRTNLRALQSSGVPYFVNMVINPGSPGRAARDVALLASWGVKRAQVGYRVGVEWSERDRDEYLELIEKLVRGHRLETSGMEILNLHNDCEPVMLSDEIIVDTDGGIFLDAAIFLERRFPGLREALHLGKLDKTAALPLLQRTKTEILGLFKERYPPRTPLGKLFLNNLALGMDAGRLMARLEREGPLP